MPPRRLTLACVALLAAACASPSDNSRPRSDEGEGRFGDRVLVEAVFYPGAWLQRDVDGGAPRPEQVRAVGGGVRAALGNRDQSIGVMFQDFEGEDGKLDVRTFGADFDARAAIEGTGDVLFVRAGGGVGMGWLDSRFAANATDLVGQLRIGLDVQASERFAIGIGICGLLLGHPGETEAYGAFVAVGAVLTF